MFDILRCTILSVQDTTILYPSCPKCFSRVTLTLGSEEQSSRWSCVKCGRDGPTAGYRYRLALRVSRGRDVLGVTVFGSSLDSFFGAPAGQLHRYLTACEESSGVPMTEWLMQRALEDCFVGRVVLLGVKLPGNTGEHRCSSPVRLQCPAEWQGPLRRTPEQYTASKMTVAHEGVFGATVLQYLQSLQRVCASSESEGPLDTSLGSEQASYHDYTRLCPGGLCSHASETTSSPFSLRLQRSLELSGDLVDSPERSLPGEREESVDSPECSLPGERNKMHRTSDSVVSDVSVAVARWSCCDGPHDSVSQESGYSEASRDKEELPGSFSSPSQTPAGPLACSFSQSFFLDELLAHAFATPFTQHDLSTDSLSLSPCSKSSGVDTTQTQECSYRADSSELAGCFDSQADSPSSTPEALVSDSEEGSYNCSVELFDDESGLDRKDMHRSEQVRGRPCKSACLSSMKQGRPRTPLCRLSIKPGRPRASLCRLSIKPGRPQTPVCLRSMKPGRPRTSVCLQSIKLAPVSQSTPILCRTAPQRLRFPRLTDQHKEASHMELDPACEPGLLETGSRPDGQIKCTSIDNSDQIECTSNNEGWCSRAGGQIKYTSRDGGQIECINRHEVGQIECTSTDKGGQIECTSIDEGGQIQCTSRDGICCSGVGGQIECTSRDGCQIECSTAGEVGQIKCTAGDGHCCDEMLATGLPREEADWSKDLFVDTYNEKY